MPERRNDPSVFAEPHLRPEPPLHPPGGVLPYADPHTAPPGQLDPNQDVALEPSGPMIGQRVENSVWDEPALSKDLAGEPGETHLTYARWIDANQPRWSAARSWALTILLALAAGPWAVFGTLWTGGEGAWGAVMLVVVGPLIEELMKIAAVLMVIEKAPFAFRSGVQLIFCAVAAGMAFAAIENLMYLYVYVPSPSPMLVTWRWTVCVALHTGCSLVAGLGTLRVWRDVWSRRAPPRLSVAYRYLVIATTLHGLYNGATLLGEHTGVLDF